MAYLFTAEPGEQTLLNVMFQPSQKSEPFHFVVTDRALYVPATRFVIAGDPRYMKQLPLAEVSEVRLEPLRPYAAWAMAAVMLIAGVVVGASMLLPFLLHLEGSYRVSGWPLALLVGGALLPFSARGRSRLVVSCPKGSFRWTPPFVVDAASRQQVREVLTAILEAVERAGVPTRHECTREDTTRGQQ